MKCENCGYELEKYEHYVVLEDGVILDESCFFDKALNELNAKSMENGFEEDGEEE